LGQQGHNQIEQDWNNTCMYTVYVETKSSALYNFVLLCRVSVTYPVLGTTVVIEWLCFCVKGINHKNFNRNANVK